MQYIVTNKIKFNRFTKKLNCMYGMHIGKRYAYCNPRSTNIGKQTNII